LWAIRNVALSGGGRITDDMVCIEGRKNGRLVSSSYGDSGGPLVCEYNGQWTVYGATFVGDRCTTEKKPAVYSGAYFHLEWIKSYVGSFPSTGGTPMVGGSGTGSPPMPGGTNSGASAPCQDTSPLKQHCGHWKDEGYCSRGGFTDYMKQYCANACGTCSSLKRELPRSMEVLPPPSPNAARRFPKTILGRILVR